MRAISTQTNIIIQISIFLVIVTSAISWGVYTYFKAAAFREVTANQQFVVDVIDHALAEKIQIIRKRINQHAEELRTVRIDQPQVVQRFLDQHVTGLIFSGGIQIIDATGRVIAGSAPAQATIGADLSKRPFFAKTITRRQGLTLEPDLGSQPHCLLTTAPLMDSTGNIAGMVVGSIDLSQEHLLQSLISHMLPNEGYVYIANKEGTLLLHPDKDSVFTTVPDGSNRGLDRARQGFAGSLQTVNSKGIAQMATFHQAEGVDWIIAVVAPLDEIFKSVTIFRNGFFLVMLLVVGVGVLLLRTLVSRIIRNLKRMIDHIQQTRTLSGPLASRLEIEGNDEVSSLAEGFNRFADEVLQHRTKIEELNLHLEKEVEARTRELTNLQKKLELILNSAGDGILGLNTHGHPLFVSTAAATMLGYEVNELLNSTISNHEMIHHSKVDGIPYPVDECPVFATFREGKSHTVDNEVFWRKDGSSFPVEYVSTPMWEGEVLIGAVVVFKDISHRRKSEQELRTSEERFRLIASSAQDAIVQFDGQGRIVFWNNAAEQIFGYSSEEIVGKDCHQMLAPARFLETATTAYHDFQNTGRGTFVGRRVELSARRSDGTEFPMELAISAVQVGGEWHAIGIVRDISERKASEEKLQAFSEILEKNNVELTAALKSAEQAAQVKSEFLANMSHEIRTPLNGVIGMAGMLLDTELDQDQKHYAETVYSCSESLLELINDILDFSKMEAGKLDLEMLNFDLRALLDNFAATLALRAHQNGLEFVCAAAPDVPGSLCGDPGRLRQILLNLAGNALKFTHQGEIVVRVGLVSETDDKAVLRFSVKDTGIGIPADKHQILFQKFTQAEASTTRLYGGTGLGLAISQQLVSAMGGEIFVESEEGRGSEFCFTACFVKQAEKERCSEGVPLAEICGVHALVVDDNATNREVLMAQLIAWGVRAEESPDGPTALQAIYRARDAGDPFRAAILDLQMPGMDGAALARAIKSDETLREIRLVLMTSLGGQRGDAKRMQEIGFAAYLSKPARHSDLFGCLSVVLADPASPQTEHSIVTRHTIREMCRGAARILLVEDNPVNQEVGLALLKKLGLWADVAVNGAEAITALENQDYDLVLMDGQMPVMDGIEATRQVRDPQSLVKNHKIPIIAMTANAMPGDRAKFLEAGMDDYVAKPINPEAFAKALDKWLPKEPAALWGQNVTETREAAIVATTESAVSVFDKASMLGHMMDDEELTRKVSKIFLDDFPNRMKALRLCVDAGDAPGAGSVAHSIKGGAATVGGEALRAVALDLERAGKAGKLKIIQECLPEMEREFSRLQEALAKHFNY